MNFPPSHPTGLTWKTSQTTTNGFTTAAPAAAANILVSVRDKPMMTQCTYKIGSPAPASNQMNPTQKVFHVRNKLGTNPPLPSSGIPLCHKFHATGQCKRSCRRSHSPLNEDEKRTWRAFIDHCREKYHQFLTSVGKYQRLQNQQHTTQTTTTAQTKPSPTIKHSLKPTATQKSNHGEKSI